MLLKCLWSFESIATDVTPQELLPETVSKKISILAKLLFISSQIWDQAVKRRGLCTEKDIDDILQRSS